MVRLAGISARAAAVALALALIPAAAEAQEKGQGEVTLSEELSGLAPAPRMAYLRHLMKEGRDDAEVFFQMAIAFHESSALDSAIVWYMKTVEKDTRHFKAYVNLGVLYDDLGKTPEAEVYFRSAVSVKPDDVLANSHLAFMLFQQKDYETAWKHLSKALEAGPRNPQPVFYLAIFFFESRMYREALVEWEKVVELDPGGYLAARARENIAMLQNALNSPAPSGDWQPKR
ncbi:MAG: tetratricopeptide repeat protein [Candidatus Krumholzibacteria bacterium]|nr:tetratricopeptide repeat protein [Candidatus Krumholzibacteria bacterium]